ncbi:transposable element Tc1 transposase [Trichonephila clavipes]|nr:transposable element Tc1 transposase [Trichonephila clavipes]
MKFQQITEFELERPFGFHEGGFFCRSMASHVQRNSSTVMRVWKQWTDEHRTTQKTGRGQWSLTSACDDRHLVCMAVNDRTAFTRQLAAR